MVTRWRVGDQAIFSMDEERFTHPELTVRGGIPILFPICGGLPEGIYTHNGETYTLKQHGFARNLPWEPGEQTTTDAASLTLSLKSNQETLVSYPFDFELIFTYRLQGSTLTIQQQYKNHSAEPMPFVSGFHPYFAVSDKAQLEFEIPATEIYDHITQETQPFAGTFDFEKDEIDVAFKPLSALEATVRDPAQGYQVTTRYDQQVSTLVFWTQKGKNFYCLEPWTAPRNALVTGDHLLHVPAEGVLSSEYSITFTPLS
jgi:galactose mutarotase-like enzyme